MTWEPHLRLTLSGTLGTTGEIFSCNLSLEPQHNAWQSLVWGVEQASLLTAYMEDTWGTNFDDLVTDCTDFWASSNADIHAYARLKRVKLAPIGTDGKYAAAAAEAAVDVAGGGGNENVNCPPWQIARKCTFETDGDLGRIKGGFYLPLPIMADATFSGETGLFTAERSQQVQTAVADFLENIANDPGFDEMDLKPVIASGGRHNANGTLRVEPGNWEIKRVNVGRRPDVIRRRANKRTEARLSDSNVEF